jgi:hypothetical protein
MVALLGPILAQLVTLGLADRTEAREIVGIDTYAEAATRPFVSLSFDWKYTHLAVSYSPSLTLTPLGSDSRRLLLFHVASVGASHQLGRTLLFANGSFGYGDQNFQELALAGTGLPSAPPAPGAGATPTTGVTPAGNAAPAPVALGTVLGGPTTTLPNSTPTSTQVRALNRVVRFESIAATVGASHTASRHLVYGGDTGYTVVGAVDSAERGQYPLVRGPRGSVFLRYGWGHRDTITSSLSLQYAEASGVNGTTPGNAVATTGSSAWLGLFNESWTHRFDLHTTGQLGAGVGASRTPVPNDGTVVAYSIYPTVGASITETTLLCRGTLAASLNVSSAPALDLITLAVDPRLSIGATTGWARDRFFSALAGATALSVASSQNANSLQSVTGSATAGYVLGRAVSVDAGVRGAWQTFGGTTSIPFSYAGFVGVTIGAQVPLR